MSVGWEMGQLGWEDVGKVKVWVYVLFGMERLPKKRIMGWRCCQRARVACIVVVFMSRHFSEMPDGGAPVQEGFGFGAASALVVSQTTRHRCAKLIMIQTIAEDTPELGQRARECSYRHRRSLWSGCCSRLIRHSSELFWLFPETGHRETHAPAPAEWRDEDVSCDGRIG